MAQVKIIVTWSGYMSDEAAESLCNDGEVDIDQVFQLLQSSSSTRIKVEQS